MIALYPGSFDPPTVGHIDIIRRVSHLFDQVHVLVMTNVEKRSSFDPQTRVGWLQACTRDMHNVTIGFDSGLLFDAAHRLGAHAIVRGLRSEADYAKEQPVADAIYAISGVETVFLKSDPAHSHVSSSLVRELIHFHGDISSLVPEIVAKEIADTRE